MTYIKPAILTNGTGKDVTEYDSYDKHIRVTVIDKNIDYDKQKDLKNEIYAILYSLKTFRNLEVKGVLNITAHISPFILKWEHHLLEGAMFYDLDIMIVYKGNVPEYNCILEERIGSHRIVFSYGEANARYIDKVETIFAHYNDITKRLTDIINKQMKIWGEE